MITKVREYRQATEFQGNFEHNPNTSDASTFGYYGGAVHDNIGGLREFAAGTIALVPGTNIVYIELGAGDPVIETRAEGNITSVRYIPLYRVEGTNVTDLRSHTMASLGTELGTPPVPPLSAFEQAIQDYITPTIYWKFDEAAPNVFRPAPWMPLWVPRN